jgi:hypothetical protein
MLYFSRSATALLATAFLGIAIIGYVAGHSRSQSSAAEKTLTASGTNLALNYPATWRAASAAPKIPGLAIAHPLVLAPAGDATQAGLVAGELAGGRAGPLPTTLLTLMPTLPETAVVDLLGSQAYRYAHVDVTGFDHQLTLYAIPNPGGQDTVLACYASAPLSSYMRTCEHIVASLTLPGQSQTYDLTPSPAYARELTTSIGALDAQRSSLRREMSVHAASAAAQTDAHRLVSAYARAAASLSKLKPSPVAGATQTTLTRSIVQTSDAYKAFAAAAAEESTAGLAAAGKQVDEAETRVQDALDQFVLLGYTQA